MALVAAGERVVKKRALGGEKRLSTVIHHGRRGWSSVRSCATLLVACVKSWTEEKR